MAYSCVGVGAGVGVHTQHVWHLPLPEKPSLVGYKSLFIVSVSCLIARSVQNPVSLYACCVSSQGSDLTSPAFCVIATEQSLEHMRFRRCAAVSGESIIQSPRL